MDRNCCRFFALIILLFCFSVRASAEWEKVASLQIVPLDQSIVPGNCLISERVFVPRTWRGASYLRVTTQGLQLWVDDEPEGFDFTRLYSNAGWSFVPGSRERAIDKKCQGHEPNWPWSDDAMTSALTHDLLSKLSISPFQQDFLRAPEKMKRDYSNEYEGENASELLPDDVTTCGLVAHVTHRASLAKPLLWARDHENYYGWMLKDFETGADEAATIGFNAWLKQADFPPRLFLKTTSQGKNYFLFHTLLSAHQNSVLQDHENFLFSHGGMLVFGGWQKIDLVQINPSKTRVIDLPVCSGKMPMTYAADEKNVYVFGDDKQSSATASIWKRSFSDLRLCLEH
jgi:hypothetical protein